MRYEQFYQVLETANADLGLHIAPADLCVLAERLVEAGHVATIAMFNGISPASGKFCAIDTEGMAIEDIPERASVVRATPPMFSVNIEGLTLEKVSDAIEEFEQLKPDDPTLLSVRIKTLNYYDPATVVRNEAGEAIVISLGRHTILPCD